jgi:hypothetical protein
MIRGASILFIVMLFFTENLSAQQFTLYSSRWVDAGSRSAGKTSSVIYIDSTRITIEQGESHLYLDIKSRQRREANFFYTVIDYNDAECSAMFSPEQMTFEYQSGQYRLKYYIDSVQQENSEALETEESDEEEESDSASNDSVKADNKIYLNTEVPPEFPGGNEAMKAWLAENTKYPAAAKKDKIIGLVEVSAVIEKNGSISDIKVRRDIGGGCGAEAMRVVKQMPSWIPGQIKNEDKRARITIKVFFPPK